MGKIFGTDGIRGTANVDPITPEMVLKVGKAAASVFRKHEIQHKHKVVIGKDTRLSGYMIESALTSGICSMGVDVLLVGPMPTPAIAHLTKSLNAHAGFVLSASHNPAHDNGIKIFDINGFKLPDKEEKEIEELILSGKIKSEHIRGELIGKAYRIDDVHGRYIEFAKSTIQSMSLEGLKIVLDCAHGAAYIVAPNIFAELGADVVVLNNHPNGLNINLDCGALHPEVIQKAVKENKADIGIALDGDADRVIVCDENGNEMNGDHIMAICGIDLLKKKKLEKNTIVATQYSNLGLDDAINKHGGKVIRVLNGDRYVVEEMRKKKLTLGGEASGHIIFLDRTTTGDGVIAALKLLKIMKEQDKKLSELAKCISFYPQVLVNVDVKEKRDFNEIPDLTNKVREIEQKLDKNGRLLLRYSGTENLVRIMVEGPNQDMIKKMADEIAEIIKKEVGK